MIPVRIEQSKNKKKQPEWAARFLLKEGVQTNAWGLR
jgi:hypothetical protein